MAPLLVPAPLTRRVPAKTLTAPVRLWVPEISSVPVEFLVSAAAPPRPPLKRVSAVGEP